MCTLKFCKMRCRHSKCQQTLEALCSSANPTPKFYMFRVKFQTNKMLAPRFWAPERSKTTYNGFETVITVSKGIAREKKRGRYDNTKPDLELNVLNRTLEAKSAAAAQQLKPLSYAEPYLGMPSCASTLQKRHNLTGQVSRCPLTHLDSACAHPRCVKRCSPGMMAIVKSAPA